jgi:hypothetical protein
MDNATITGKTGDEARLDMKSEDTVHHALKALADADATRHAPPHVESVLLDAFDRQRARASSPRAAWRAVVAAIVVVPLAMAAYRGVFDSVDVGAPPPSEPHTMSVRNERPPSGLDHQIDPQTATETARPLPERRAKPRVASRVRGSQPVTGHIVSTNRESEMIGQTVHLRLPRSALLLFGIPIVEPEIEGTVNVELWLSENGQARAIRIVQ